MSCGNPENRSCWSVLTWSSRAAAVAAGLLLAAGAVACGDAGEKAAVQMVGALDQGKITGTRGTMETIATGLRAYAVDRSGYPEAGDLDAAMAELVPAHLRSPLSTDAWGNRFSYNGDAETYTLTSSGQDGRFGTADDLVMIDGRFTSEPRRGGL